MVCFRINADPTLLPDIKLGVKILDTCRFSTEQHTLLNISHPHLCSRDTYALNQSLEFIRSSLNNLELASEWECGGGTVLCCALLKLVVFNRREAEVQVQPHRAGGGGGGWLLQLRLSAGKPCRPCSTKVPTVLKVANLLRLFRIPQVSY